MCADKPGGMGPWFNCLFFNTNERSKKKTHLLAHTLPHLGLDYLNRNSEGWAIIQKIGPFEVWQDAVDFHKAWNEKTRGKVPRFERGLELYHMYKDTYNLKLWMPTQTQEEVIQTFKRKRERSTTSTTANNNNNKPSSTTMSPVIIISNETLLKGMLEIFEDTTQIKIGRIRSQEMKKRKK